MSKISTLILVQAYNFGFNGGYTCSSSAPFKSVECMQLVKDLEVNQSCLDILKAFNKGHYDGSSKYAYEVVALMN